MSVQPKIDAFCGKKRKFLENFDLKRATPTIMKIQSDSENELKTPETSPGKFRRFLLQSPVMEQSIEKKKKKMKKFFKNGIVCNLFGNVKDEDKKEGDALLNNCSKLFQDMEI